MSTCCDGRKSGFSVARGIKHEGYAIPVIIRRGAALPLSGRIEWGRKKRKKKTSGAGKNTIVVKRLAGTRGLR